MKLCNHCQTELLTEFSLPGRSARCPVCARLTDVESTDGKAENHSRAWWCFGLGISCLPLLALSVAFTANRIPWPSIIACGLAIIFGATAIYLGIRAMLRMRYRKATALTKIAAATGTLSGGCFGLLVGGFVAVIALVVFVIMQTSESTKEPETAFAMYQKMMHVDLPDDSLLKPYRASSSPFMFGRVDFRDDEDRQKCNTWLRITRFPRWTTANRGQFTQIIHDDIYSELGRDGLSKIDTEKLKWVVEGNEISVTKNVWKQVSTKKDGTSVEREFEQYFVLSDSEELTHGLSLIHDKTNSNLSKPDIETIFASFESLR